ncbi:MAG: hypothetical protein ACKO23_05150 [Gemmataceae bacterium]
MRLMLAVPLMGLAWLVAGLSSSRADLIFLKDGHVLQGTVRREISPEFDPVSREMNLIPKGFFMLDDGPRRVYFSPAQVRIVEPLPAPSEERVAQKSSRMIVNPRPFPPHLEVVEEGKWDYRKWEREYAFRTPGVGRVGTIQGLGSITPYFARVDAVTKFRWSAAYLTREWDPNIVVQLLRGHSSMEENSKDSPPQILAKRMKLCDFLAQAGLCDEAAKEIARAEKEFPEEKDRLEFARTTLDRLRNRDSWEQIKNWYQAARYQAVRKRLDAFQPGNGADRILADIREMKEKLINQSSRLEEATQALEDTAREAESAEGKALAEAVSAIRAELHPATVDRLEAFLGQYRDARRQKMRGQAPKMTPEQLLSLAITGWHLGSPSAENQTRAALNLWKTRKMVLEYLREPNTSARKKILADYQMQVSPRVELEEVAQMIDHLPPVDPARDLSSEPREIQAGVGRQQTRYHLKLPPEYSHSRSYPVLFLLHNIGEKAPAVLRRFEAIAADHGYILAAPEWSRSISDEYGYSEREHEVVLAALRDLRRRFQVDSDRIFLFGNGEGGKMAFDVGLAHPDCFAGVIPMAAGPNLYSKRYWRNAQYLPFYVVNGTRGGDSTLLLRDQFNNWVLRGYPALWVEYKGRGTEFFSGELPFIFDWMRHQKRAFPMQQLGTDGNNTAFGNEFCTMRAEDNRFYWLSAGSISPRYLVAPENWNNLASPASLTARIDPDTNEINVKTLGIQDLTVWFGRNPSGKYMIDFNKPVTIRVGLRNYIVNRKAVPSLEVLLEDLHQRADRKHLFVARMDITVR